MNPTQALFDILPPQHSPEEFNRILEVDFAANHQGREYDFDFTQKAMRLWRESGGMIFCAPKVMFVVQEKSPDSAEFHSVNGGSGRDLSVAVNMLLAALTPFYTFAFTYYDNPKVNELLRWANCPTSFQRIDGGVDLTFEATFYLRG
jgi:hypothetical protein